LLEQILCVIQYDLHIGDESSPHTGPKPIVPMSIIG
jgi:hypothetical protein